ncbi:MAG: hypothetical protein KBD01_20430, partial [Acidobacteria bacterium]|nr:hypothetical protein [Acidobacteriota bacterium]
MFRLLPIALSVGLACVTTVSALDLGVNARQTFLHTNMDAAVDSPAIALSSAGVFAGDCVHIERLGFFDDGPSADVNPSLLGVFSRSSTLLPPAERYRVPDAVDAGTDFTSSATYRGTQPTDIPEDFVISFATTNGADLLVPPQVTHLFVGPHDSYYQDNSDPNGDYMVRIVPTIPLEVSPRGSAMPLVFLDQQTLRWEDVGMNCADTYNVYRGDVEDLPLRQYGACLQSGITGNTASDPLPPDPGRG